MPRLLAPIVILALFAACGPSSPTVLVASSLAGVADELTRAWDARGRVSEAGSQVLAAQIEAGASAEAVLLADPDIAQRLARAALAPPPVTVAKTGLSVLVAAGSDVGSIADLASRDVRLVLADAGVPLGRYTRTGLDRLERAAMLERGTSAAGILANARSLEDSARLVVAKLVAGEADAAIVYETDSLRAVAADPSLRILAWPEPGQIEVVYTAQALTARGEDLVRFLRSDAAASIWEEHGFKPH
ncbi:MAG: substrate-binding domain-containing protein [Actinobacteria bacterium]|nr:substrate-binding domain-containing protein [Actinomycetota bacterium]